MNLHPVHVPKSCNFSCLQAEYDKLCLLIDIFFNHVISFKYWQEKPVSLIMCECMRKVKRPYCRKSPWKYWKGNAHWVSSRKNLILSDLWKISHHTKHKAQISLIFIVFILSILFFWCMFDRIWETNSLCSSWLAEHTLSFSRRTLLHGVS
jgi:hypothetical protein